MKLQFDREAGIIPETGAPSSFGTQNINQNNLQTFQQPSAQQPPLQSGGDDEDDIYD
jgi:hypothetical protein